MDYSVWLQQRVGIETNVINPQTSKAHRALFFRPDWETKVDTTEPTQLANFMWRVGEGFGVKTDRLNWETVDNQVKSIVENPVVVKAVTLLQGAIYQDAALSPENCARGRSVFEVLAAVLGTGGVIESESIARPQAKGLKQGSPGIARSKDPSPNGARQLPRCRVHCCAPLGRRFIFSCTQGGARPSLALGWLVAGLWP